MLVQWHHHIWHWMTLKGQSQGDSDFEGLDVLKEQSYVVNQMSWWYVTIKQK